MPADPKADLRALETEKVNPATTDIDRMSPLEIVQVGKTFGNLMVDLRATNHKLQRRVVGIVQKATGLEKDAAASLLRASDNDVKTAIVAGLANIDPAAARERLAAHGNSVRKALEDIP